MSQQQQTLFSGQLNDQLNGQNLPSQPVSKSSDGSVAAYAAVLILANGIPTCPQTSAPQTSDKYNEDGYWYAIPQHQADKAKEGSIVHVPFGRQPALAGLILHIQTDCPPHMRGKTIRSLSEVLSESPLITPDQWAYLRYISEYYATSLSDVVMTAIPSALLQQPKSVIHLAKRYHPSLLASFHPQAQACLRLLETAGKPLTPKYIMRQLQLNPKSWRSLFKQLSNARMINQHLDWQRPTDGKQMNVITATHNNKAAKTPRQQTVLDYIRQQPNRIVLQKQIMQTLSVTTSVINKLVEQDFITLSKQAIDPRSELFSQYLNTQHQSIKPTKQLTNAQAHCVETVWAASQANNLPEQREFVLHGVTGSGKTEVYIELTQRMMAQGKPVLFLVPEISLTGPLAKRFTDVFGKQNVLIWHSHLATGERSQAWKAVANGDIPIIIGARSAILLPHTKLGLIMLDEAHDSSYKQESPAPRYHAHTLAQYWAKHHRSTLLLGSATPDIVHYKTAKDNNTLITLTDRFGKQDLAQVHVVDARERVKDWLPSDGYNEDNENDQLNNKNKAATSLPKTNTLTPPPSLTQPLYNGIKGALARGEQALVLINRRGFYTLVQCTDCQQFVQCPSCSISLTFHKSNAQGQRSNGQVHCHHCGYMADKPTYCPHCAGRRVQLQGVGTQRIEDELAQCFPEARIARLDRDVAQRKYATQQVIDDFTQHKADILVGTQMVAKGLDIHNVTQVGVVQADSAFVLPDYRASERGFQLLTQVAGRAGRGEKDGHVYLQSWNVEHPVLQFSQAQAYEPFYDYELAIRKQFQFPPYSQLFRFIVMSEDERATLRHAELLKHHLEKKLHDMMSLTTEDARKLLILGPAPCAIERINNRYRYHLLVKNPFGQPVHDAITDFYRTMPPVSAMKVILDIDAQSLL